MENRDATVAVIGAGDFIGAAIAKKFAAEGFTIFAGRRKGEKLAPLVAEIEAAGGRVVGCSLDARKEQEISTFLRDADAAGIGSRGLLADLSGAARRLVVRTRDPTLCGKMVRSCPR